MKRLIVTILFLATFLNAGNIVFGKNSISVGGLVGSGSIDNGYNSNNYFIVGAEVNYFVIDGFSVGVGATHWFGNEPTLTEYYFPLTYYIDTSSKIYPYVGVTYKYTSYSKYIDNYSSVVTRGGVAYRVSFGYISFGYAYDKSLDDNIDDRSYPELTFGIVF
jgi:hypothetical protein